jgi:phosphatidylglycerol:prolipoprotein diacylglycerol transferase
MHPVLIDFGVQIGSWTPRIHSYGLMLALSLILGISICVRLAERQGYDRQTSNSALMWIVIFSLVGARLLFVATNFDLFRPDFPRSVFQVLDIAGIVAYGGILGGTTAALVYFRFIHHLPFLRFADTAAPGIALGLGFTRIGCFMAGCDYGTPTTGPLGVIFPGPNPAQSSGSEAFRHHLREHLIDTSATHSLPVHPTQLYESAFGFALMGSLLWYYKRRRFDGAVIAAFFGLYGLWRFGVEYLRGDIGRGNVGILSTSQFISVFTVLAAVAAFVALRNRRPASDPVVTKATAAVTSPAAGKGPPRGARGGKRRR